MIIEYLGVKFDCEFDYEKPEEEVGLAGGHTLTSVTLWCDNTELIDVLSVDTIQHLEMYAEGRY